MSTKNIFNDISFYFSIFLGALFAALSYAYWLPDVYPIGSIRFYLAIPVVFLAIALICFILARKVVIPGVQNIEVSERKWFYLMCIGIGVLFFISTVNFKKLQNRYLYFFLPIQSLEVKGTINPEGNGRNIKLFGFTTSYETIGTRDMSATGWRADDSLTGKFTLEEIDGNYIKWSGTPGGNTALVFETSPAGGEIEVSWNGNIKTYSLYSQKMDTLKVSQKFPVPFFAGWLTLTFFMLIGSILTVFAAFLLLLKSRWIMVPGKTGRFTWIWYALPMLIVWLCFWLVFYPGFMSSDSINEWQQMETGVYVDWHPPIHTMTNWLITRIWHSPAAVSLAQLIVLSGVLGWGLAMVRRLGTPAWVTWLTSIFLAISPANSTMAIVLWKDIPFSISVVSLCIIILDIISGKGKWLGKKFNWIILGFLLALIALYRQNGILVSAGISLLLPFSFRALWKKAVLAGLLFATLFGFTKLGFFRIMNISSDDRARYPLVAYNLIAAHNSAKMPFTPEETLLFKNGYPDKKIPYNCYRNIEMNAKIDRDYLHDHAWELFDLAINLTLRNPGVSVSHYACVGAFVYRVYEDIGSYYFSFLEITPNEFGIKPLSILPGYKDPLLKFVKFTMDKYWLNWFFWRSPFWMYLLLFGGIGAFLRRRSWRIFLIIAPPLLAILPLIILSLGQIFRYVYSMYLVGILFSGYFWTLAVSKDNSDKGNSF